MALHEQRFTLGKLKSRIKIIESHLIRDSHSIKSFKVFEHKDATENPLIAAGIDDSNWQTITPPAYWGRWNSNYTFRTKFIVPENYEKLGQIALQFKLGSIHGRLDFCHPEALVFIDGKSFAAADKFHTKVFLPKQFCDGREHQLALHIYTGKWGQFDAPIDIKLFMEDCSIVVIDKRAEDFLAAARVAVESADALPADNFAKSRIINALDDSFNKLNLIEPLGENFYASIQNAHDILKEELKKAGHPLDVNITAIGHSHIDVAWLWPLEQTRRKCGRTFHTALALMDEFDDYIFTQSQPQLYDYVKQDYPQLFTDIKKKVAENKWEIIGGMWVEADCNLSGAESLARQFLIGRTFFEKHFGKGAESPVFWLPDVFGYCANLPQLIKLAGMEYFFTIKLSWNQYNKMPYDSFWWQGLDGTKVLTHFGTTCSEDGRVTYNAMANPAQIYNTFASCSQKENHSELMTCYGHGDGGGGPTREMLENIRELNNFPAMPKVQHGKAIEFFKKLENTSGPTLPTWNGELYLEFHRGTYTTQSRNKRANRKSEFGLHNAEFLCSLAQSLNPNFEYPADQLEKAWKLVCLNQFHDIIPGSSVSEVYVDSLKQYAEVEEIINQTSETALVQLSKNIGGDIIITNPASFVRNDATVSDITLDENQQLQTSDGRAVNTQKTENGTIIDTSVMQPYSAIGLKIVNKKNVVADTGLKVKNNLLENNFIKVEFNSVGDIISFYDKTNKREIIPTGRVANQMLAFEDRPLSWDAWDIDIFYDDKVFYSRPANSIKVVESGPLRAVIEIKRTILSSTYTQKISLAYNSSRLDFDTEIDWQERCMLLKAAFPVEILSSFATYEIQWGNIKKPTHRNTSWDWARFENCAQKWVDLSEPDFGVSLMNDCKYGHDIRDNVIRITLLRSPTMPDPLADKGIHKFTYSLMPHSGAVGNQTINAAYCLNDPIIVSKGFANSDKVQTLESMFKTDRENVIIETIKKAEDDNGFIVRMYESLGSRCAVNLSAGFAIKSCFETDLIEQNKKQLEVKNNLISFNIKPFQILTLRIVC
ncbi:MAG: alpha-mannosidase [Planctomycetes bacterium GWF2_41_51]|nr:MAG: alpha-mannosidase [Planctomycetes bacterium GWF2_41_51]HBG28098.1 alpha-mannosidase [Phycisphaerales bacterium]